MTAEVVSNNRFRPAPAPDDASFDSLYAGTDTTVDVGAMSSKTHLLSTIDEHSNDRFTNGHNEHHENGTTHQDSYRKKFSLKQVRRNITKQLSLDDFDFQAARERNEQIEQIALNDPELCTVVQGRWKNAWLGFLNTLSDTFTVARLAINLSSYLGVGATCIKCTLAAIVHISTSIV